MNERFDFIKVNDDSDQVFVDAFLQDIQRIGLLLNLKKRLMGIVDQDTKSTVYQDFDEQKYPGSKEKYEIDIMN